jgi:excisionase family DNA binding protein
MHDAFYTVDEFAKLLKVHPQTIRKAIKKGRLQACRAGYGKRSPLRIPGEELSRIRVMDFEETKKNILSYKDE